MRDKPYPRRAASVLLFVCMCLALAAPLLAQEAVVRGQVRDAVGEPVIGASVLVKGTGNGTITDASGNWSLTRVEKNNVLVFSFIGYDTQEIVYTGQNRIDITLEEDVKAIDEVVVIGYGSLNKKELSSSIVQVNRSDFQQGSMSSPIELLQGKVAGLSVNLTAQSNPNADMKNALQIRGASSLSASNAPLIIVDGIAGADYQTLSSQDIESITVLKDAGSASIYGTRGANGVILITTRKGSGKEGTARITYDSWLGINIMKPKPEVLTPEQFRQHERDTDYGASTDWWDLLARDFSYDNNQYLALDGTTRNGYYGASVNYRKATGLDRETDRQEYGGRFTIQQRGIGDLFEFNASINARKVKQKDGTAPWGSALTTNPTMPVYDETTGEYYQPTSPTGASNPKSQLDLIQKEGDRTYILASAEAKAFLLRKENQALNVSLNYSLNLRDYDYYYYAPSNSADSYWNGYTGNAQRRDQKWWTNRLELLANYTLHLNDHDFKVVLGYNYEEANFEELQARNFNFAFDQTAWNDLGSGTYLKDGKSELSSSKNKSKLIGFFGRINYNWKGWLMASASYRREGSTKFGADNKWGDFLAGSLAWEIAAMPFMNGISIVNSLKPRVSYGVTGRSDFDPYLSQQTYKADGQYYMDGSWNTGFAPSVNANAALAWEKAVVTNVGIDFSLWNRLRGSIEYYDRQSKDLLYRYTAPQPPFVYDKILVNVGTIQNRGFELSLDGDILTRTKVKWTSGILLSEGSTRLKVLSNDVFQSSYLDLALKGGPGTSEYFFRVEEGGKIGQFYGLKTAGVDDNGNMLVYNKADEIIPIGDAKIADKRFIGNGIPKFFLSWNNTFRYKNFDLNLFWRGAFGFDIYNNRLYGMGLEGCGSANVLSSAYETDLKQPGGLISSYYLEKGNFFKLENVTLGYNFKPRENKYVNDLRVYLSAKNLVTITNYSGNDPSTVAVNGLEPGIDNSGSYPQATVVSLGLTIHFK